MSEDSTFDEEITITPPLTWNECRVTPGTDDAEVRIDERVVDGDAGQTRILTGVAIVAKKFAHGPSLAGSIQAIIDAHPEHEFGGHIEEWVEVGYRDLPRRYAVQDRRVVTVTAAWPDGQPQDGPASDQFTAVGRLRAIVRSVDQDGWRDTGYPSESDIDEVLDERDVLAARVAELEAKQPQGVRAAPAGTSVVEDRCFSVKCSACGDPLTDPDHGGEPHFRTAPEALSNARAEDWHVSAAGGAVCNEDDAAHIAAIRAHHAEDLDPAHWCWVTAYDESEAMREDQVSGR